MPENPFASTFARSAIAARTVAHRQRRIDARGVTAQQVQLQRGEIVLVDPRLGEVAEAGVDAVDRLLAIGLAIDNGASGRDADARVGRESDLRAIVRDRQQVFQ